MCARCGWYHLLLRIDAHLERAVMTEHASRILDKAREIIVANQHATDDQVNAIEAVLEQREARA